MDGDERFDELFRAEYPAILRTVCCVVTDVEVAKEVTQEAFAAAFARWGRVGRYDRPGAWVRRVAIRMAVRAQRRSEPEHVLPAAAAVEREAVLDLHQALLALSPAQRAAIVLHYL